MCAAGHAGLRRGERAVQYYAEPRVLFQVSRGSFLPPPNVDSTVIRLDVRSSRRSMCRMRDAFLPW